MSELQNKRNRSQREVEIDLIPIIKALWRGAWIILLLALVCGSAAYFATRIFITPTYRTSFSAYVNNRNNAESTTSVTNSDLMASQSLTSTYAEIITSRTVLESALEQAELNYLYGDIRGSVSANTSSEETEIITISVTMENPGEAVALAEAISSVAPSFVSRIVEGTSMQIIDAPVLPSYPVSPNYRQNALYGLLLGAILAAAVIVLKELLNDSVKEEEELENHFGIPVIGVIPDLFSAIDQGEYGYANAGRQKGGAK